MPTVRADPRGPIHAEDSIENGVRDLIRDPVRCPSVTDSGVNNNERWSSHQLQPSLREAGYSEAATVTSHAPEQPAAGGVHALVPVVPADPVARRGIAPVHVLDHPVLLARCVERACSSTLSPTCGATGHPRLIATTNEQPEILTRPINAIGTSPGRRWWGSTHFAPATASRPGRRALRPWRRGPGRLGRDA